METDLSWSLVFLKALQTTFLGFAVFLNKVEQELHVSAVWYFVFPCSQCHIPEDRKQDWRQCKLSGCLVYLHMWTDVLTGEAAVRHRMVRSSRSCFGSSASLKAALCSIFKQRHVIIIFKR